MLHFFVLQNPRSGRAKASSNSIVHAHETNATRDNNPHTHHKTDTIIMLMFIIPHNTPTRSQQRRASAQREHQHTIRRDDDKHINMIHTNTRSTRNTADCFVYFRFFGSISYAIKPTDTTRNHTRLVIASAPFNNTLQTQTHRHHNYTPFLHTEKHIGNWGHTFYFIRMIEMFMFCFYFYHNLYLMMRAYLYVKINKNKTKSINKEEQKTMDMVKNGFGF